MNISHLGCILGCIALLLPALYIAAFILSWIGAALWSFIDDQEAPAASPFNKWVCLRVMKWEERDSDCFPYRDSKDAIHAGFLPFGYVLLFSTALFFLAIGSTGAPTFTLGLTIAVGAIFAARFGRRIQKKLTDLSSRFTSHTKDKNAHR